jgi:arsenate reductase (thioredoxin)
MAEGWTRHLKSDQIEAYSPRIESHGLNPQMVKVMAEIGVDVTSPRSENIRDFTDTALNVVVTVCGHAHETCPILPVNCKVVHSGFPDPPKMAKVLAEKGASEEEQLTCYRQVRDEIRTYVESLPESLNL